MISAPVFTEQELAAITEHFKPVPLDKAGTRFSKMWQSVQLHGAKGGTLELLAESFAENLRGGEAYEWGHHAAFTYATTFVETVKALHHRIDVINPDDDLHTYTLRIADYLQNGVIHERPQWGHGFLDFDTQNAVSDIRELLSITLPAHTGAWMSGF